ncbi:MAG TPA: hypothetical protein IGS17_09310 [Oscillatoriales cyanobacterium M59_W2019_021]|nr:MAG: hypothetical protein D6728_19300 [Cyanobacteria bacterium J055]HIK33593.1 hypothetical protein [Oscillatoriales cyanobacterium M4454_W2019_049]HIK51106.1 hypothetical protein [Oscillatoriales cyanobacterium M59_W2019_021]
MIEVLIWSLLVGSLGIEGAISGGWLYWQQRVTKQHDREEEEFLTHYNADKEVWDVESQPVNGNNGAAFPNGNDPRLAGWEYKIVRASRDLFRDPKILKQLRDEEAEVGWILLEKLDDRRIRFKRPIAMANLLDIDSLKIDPYRSHYGPTSSRLSWIAAIVALTALALPAYLGYTLVRMTLDRSGENPTELSQVKSTPIP